MGQIKALNHLPGDILDHIFSHLRIDEFIQLCSIEAQPFLQQNQNIKFALDNAIHNSGGFLYNWIPDRAYRYLNEYQRDELPGLNLRSRSQFRILYGYCLREKVEVVVNVFHGMCSMEDIIQFDELIGELQPSGTIKLGVAFKFQKHVNGYSVDLTRWLSLLSNFKKHLYLLSIDLDNGDIHHNNEINLGDFKDIGVLKLCNCYIKGSFLQCTTLKELSYAPVADQAEAFSIWDLPTSLKSLKLVADHRIGQAAVKPLQELCPKLEELDLELHRLPTIQLDEYLCGTIKHLTSPKTTKIRIHELYFRCENLDVFGPCLNSLAGEKGFVLNTLSLRQDTCLKLNFYPLRELELVNTSRRAMQLSESLPSTLKKLRLFKLGRNASQTKNLFPLGLEFLDLLKSDFHWTESDLDFTKFLHLKELVLSHNILGPLTKSILFPDSIETLNLNYNMIQTLDDITFPKCMRHLNLTGNMIKRLYGGPLPLTLRTINVSYNALNEIDLLANNDGELLQLDTLRIDHNSDTLLESSICKIPTSLAEFFMYGGLAPKSIGRPPAAHSYLSEGELDSLYPQVLLFPNQNILTKLDLQGCGIYNPKIQFPESLEVVNLSRNMFSKIPTSLLGLPNLRVLYMSGNQLDKISVQFTTSSIEVLDFSYNKISKFNLTFPTGETNLRVLKLNDNHLGEFTMNNLGGDKGAKHTKLYEIELIDNWPMPENHIKTLISTLPPSTKCLWYENTTHKIWGGVEFKIVVNELSGNLVKEKALHRRF